MPEGACLEEKVGGSPGGAASRTRLAWEVTKDFLRELSFLGEEGGLGGSWAADGSEPTLLNVFC